MATVKILRKGIMPFRKLKVSINNESFHLKGNEFKQLTIPDGFHNLVLKMDFWESTTQININSEEKSIVIKHYLPDFFYILGIAFSVVFAFLTFFSIIGYLWFTGFVFIFLIPQFYLFLFRFKNFFFLKFSG